MLLHILEFIILRNYNIFKRENSYIHPIIAQFVQDTELGDIKKKK